LTHIYTRVMLKVMVNYLYNNNYKSFQLYFLGSMAELNIHCHFILLIYISALYFCATLFLVACGVCVVLLYIYYTRAEHCTLNKLFIVVNASLCVIICFVSVLPCTTRCKRFIIIIVSLICKYFVNCVIEIISTQS